MTERIRHVLFVCSHNSARSIMAEGILRNLGRGRFVAHSAGSHPADRVHPMALRTLQEMRLPTEGYRSKDWAEFAQAGAPTLDFVLTVCDKAAGEACPVWPGQPMTAHWGVADPAAFQGTEEETAKVFWDTASVLKRRIELMLALPMEALDSLSLQQQMRDIGTR
ncbi:MAG: arsenate reductase ArsC [Lysobacterales bacterium]|jgi:arsenate reductase